MMKRKKYNFHFSVAKIAATEKWKLYPSSTFMNLSSFCHN